MLINIEVTEEKASEQHLFKFTTTPNNPVCEAELIFFVPNKEHAQIRLKELLGAGYHFNDADEEYAELTYLGKFTPAIYFPDGVVTFQNGEY